MFQSIASFGCDVYSFGRPSIWKPIDRVFASSFVLWECIKLFWLHMSLAEWVTWFIALCCGLYCFKMSMDQLKLGDEEIKSHSILRSRYIWWHTMWHLSLPIGAGVWMMVRANRLYNIH